MTHRLAPRAFPRIIELIDVSRLGTATGVLSVLWRFVIEDDHHPDTYVGLSHRDIADELTIGVSKVGSSVRRLIAAGVVECDGLGCGQRPDGYRFRDIASWVGVPWRSKMTAIEAALIVEQWLRPVEVPNPAFARARGRALAPIAPTRVRAVVDPRERALQASKSTVARAPGEALRGRLRPGGVSTSGGANSTVPDDVASEEEQLVDDGLFRRARRAIFGRAIPASGGRRFINGPPKRQLCAAIAAHGIEAVVIAVERVPADTYLVPDFLDALDDVLEGADDELPASIVDERRAKVEQRITALRNQYDVYRRAGVDEDDEQLTVILEQVAECETELEQLRSEGAA